MAVELREETYLGQEAFVIENEYLLVRVLKKLGAKIASIYHKPMGFELLHQPVLSEYKLPENIGAKLIRNSIFQPLIPRGLMIVFRVLMLALFLLRGRNIISQIMVMSGFVRLNLSGRNIRFLGGFAVMI